ncbi:MAG: redoxin domain-containing protein [Candidatus Wallbacteria bacterium]|nr:redoxin domain-containing protein [Candidatus Wallbacteria bacterium]
MRASLLLLSTSLMLPLFFAAATAQESAVAAPANPPGEAGDPHAGHAHAQAPANPHSMPQTPLSSAEQAVVNQLDKLRGAQPKDPKDQAARMAEAEKILRKLVAEFPNSPNREGYAVGLVNMLVGALAEQIQAHPDAKAAPELRLERAKFLIEAGEGKKAIEELEVLRKDPKLVDFMGNATFLVAYAYDLLDDVTKSVAEFGKLEADKDTGIAAQGFLGESEAWQKRGNKEKAIQAVDNCLKKISAPKEVARLQGTKRTLGFMGQPAPDVELKGLDGKPVSLKAHRGKVVLIDFFASWCLPCYKEIPGLKKLAEKHRDAKFAMIGISLDDAGNEKKVEKFAKDRGIAWPVALPGKSFESEVCQKYSVEGIPFLVLVDTDGKVITAGLRGPDLNAAVSIALAKVK